MSGEDGSWFLDLHRVDADTDVGGMTAGELAAYHSRPADPPGTAWVGGEVYRSVDGRDLRLWGYRAAEAGGAARPGIVFVHGGGWIGGHPFMHLRHCWHLAARGWAALTIEYRRFPEATWPAAFDDARAAMAWARSNAAWLGLDPSRLVVSGGSAGGHLALLVAVVPGPAEERADAAAVWYPITDMLCPGVPDLRAAAVDFLGTDAPDVAAAASPASYVRPGLPAILTITGDADETVPVEGVRAFHRLLDDAGVPNRLHVVPDAIHGWDFAPEPWDQCFAVLTDFLDGLCPAPS
jgi:acetyl esterase/lipase